VNAKGQAGAASAKSTKAKAASKQPERAAAKAVASQRGSTMRSPKQAEPASGRATPASRSTKASPVAKPAARAKAEAAKPVAATPGRPAAVRVGQKSTAPAAVSSFPSTASAAPKATEATVHLNDQSKVPPKLTTSPANIAAQSQPVRPQAPARSAEGAVAAPAASHNALAKDDAVKSSTTMKEAVKTQPGAMATAPAVNPGATLAKPVEKSAPKPGTHRTGFKSNEFIVYPAHGVGQIIAIEEQEVAGFKLELFVINFVKDKMTLKVPLPKVLAGAIRKLADAETVQKALETLTGRARVKRTMWSRRAQEYEAKINSGDLHSIAEVVRDLYRSDAQPEQSYSERQLYEAALDRMAREIAAVQKLTETEALKLIDTQLQKGPRRGGKADADVEADAAEGDAETDPDGDVEEAA
jgi:CarD family transcriptional regulator